MLLKLRADDEKRGMNTSLFQHGEKRLNCLWRRPIVERQSDNTLRRLHTRVQLSE